MKEKENKGKYNYELTVMGRVHGVGFRYSTVHMARQYGIKGIVKNTRDGNVFLVIEGNKIATDLMIAWCRQGPGTANVTDLIVVEGEVRGYNDFRIVY